MENTDVYITNAVTEEDFEKRKPDVVYYNRLISDNVLLLQSKYHFRVVVDVDDYWHLNPAHIMHQHSKDNNFAAHQIKHIQLADVVTTTHARLAEQIYPYNKNVIVLPNAIPNHKYFEVDKTKSAKGHVRIFWQGSITHEGDIKMLTKCIKQLDKNKFMMVLAGYTEQVEWERICNYYTNNQRMPGVILPGVPPNEYYKYYQYADVCVVPLLSNKFNAYKSNLKILEAAHLGLPVIASNVHPYKDMDGVMYVNNNNDWYNLLQDRDAQIETAVILAAYCKQHYNFDTINKQRATAIN